MTAYHALAASYHLLAPIQFSSDTVSTAITTRFGIISRCRVDVCLLAFWRYISLAYALVVIHEMLSWRWALASLLVQWDCISCGMLLSLSRMGAFDHLADRWCLDPGCRVFDH